MGTMGKKIIISTIAIIVFVLLISVSLKNNNQIDNNQTAINERSSADKNDNQSVKEFSMESFTEIVDGKPKPQFSLKEITVNKGDLVRIKIFVKNGKHDFKIDEFNVFADTPTEQETIVEFTADKVGEFVYYCNQPGHRAAGHWGTLKVVE